MKLQGGGDLRTKSRALRPGLRSETRLRAQTPPQTLPRRPYTVYRLFALPCRGRMHAARGRIPHDIVFVL